MATFAYSVCEIMRKIVAALLLMSEHLLERENGQWLISVLVSITVSLLTVYRWSANVFLGKRPCSGRLLMCTRLSLVFIVRIVLRLGALPVSMLNKGHTSCSAIVLYC